MTAAFNEGVFVASHSWRQAMVRTPEAVGSDHVNPRYPAISFSPFEKVGK